MTDIKNNSISEDILTANPGIHPAMIQSKQDNINPRKKVEISIMGNDEEIINRLGKLPYEIEKRAGGGLRFAVFGTDLIVISITALGYLYLNDKYFKFAYELSVFNVAMISIISYTLVFNGLVGRTIGQYLFRVIIVDERTGGFAAFGSRLFMTLLICINYLCFFFGSMFVPFRYDKKSLSEILMNLSSWKLK